MVTITYNIIDYARYFINGEIKYFKSYSFYIYSIIKKEEDNKESEFSLLSSFKLNSVQFYGNGVPEKSAVYKPGLTYVSETFIRFLRYLPRTAPPLFVESSPYDNCLG